MQLGVFLARALRTRWDSYQEQLRKCQRDFSEDTVHELRVSTRRLLSHLVMLNGIAPAITLKKTRRVLKRRLKGLGGLRDIQVQRLFIESRLARLPELMPVRSLLGRRERRLAKSVRKKVRGSKIRKLGKWISGLEGYLAWNSECTTRSEQLSRLVMEAVSDAFAQAVARRDAITPDNLETIHRTRTAFKKFRYMVEALSPDFTGLTQRELRKLAYYQRRMGNLQDLEVMQQLVRSLAHKREGMKALLRGFDRYLQKSIARALQTFLLSADELGEFWPLGQMAVRQELVHAA